MSYVALRGLTDMSDGCPKGLVWDSVIDECMVPEPGTTKIDWRTGEETTFSKLSNCQSNADCTSDPKRPYCCRQMAVDTRKPGLPTLFIHRCTISDGTCGFLNRVTEQSRQCELDGGESVDTDDGVACRRPGGELELLVGASSPAEQQAYQELQEQPGRLTASDLGTRGGEPGKDNTRLYLFAGAGAALLLAGLYYMGASSE